MKKRISASVIHTPETEKASVSSDCALDELIANPGSIPSVIWKTIMQRCHYDFSYGYTIMRAFIPVADYATTYFVYKLIHKHYPMNVRKVSVANFAMNEISNYIYEDDVSRDLNHGSVRNIHNNHMCRWVYDIIGHDFLVPYRNHKGTYVYINRSVDYVGTSNSDSITKKVYWNFVFIGVGAQKYGTEFRHKLHNLIGKLNGARRKTDTIIVNYENLRTGDTTDVRIPKRSFDSVFINHHNKNELITQLRLFIKDETRKIYHDIQQPYHFNILLHGLPGTGKNSIIYAIATMLNRPIYQLSHSDFISDNSSSSPNIISLISGGYRDVIFVIDELDIIAPKREDNTDTIFNFSQLLSFLDVIGDGNIVVCCTNYYNRLDPAVVRSGRFNITMELDYWNYDLLQEVLEYHSVSVKELEDAMHEPVNPEFTFAPATIMDHIRSIKLQKIGIGRTVEETAQ